MPSLLELDEALRELQNDVALLHDQLARQQAEYRLQVKECMRMAACEIASVRSRQLTESRSLVGQPGVTLQDAPMRLILADVATFKQKLEDKAATNTRLTAENDRLRAALIGAQREKESALDSLSRLSSKYAELKAAITTSGKSNQVERHPELQVTAKVEAQAQTDELPCVEQADVDISALSKKTRVKQSKRLEPKLTDNPWVEESLELKGVRIALDKAKPTSARAISVERLALPRPKSPVDAFSLAAAKVRNYNIRDD